MKDLGKCLGKMVVISHDDFHCKHICSSGIPYDSVVHDDAFVRLCLIVATNWIGSRSVGGSRVLRNAARGAVMTNLTESSSKSSPS